MGSQDRLGAEAGRATSYAWAAFLNKGVPLALWDGLSEWNPCTSVSRALRGRDPDQRETASRQLSPRSSELTMEQAIAAYTTGPAFAELQEKEKGG